MRNGLPEIQYLTSAKEGEEGVGAAAAAAAAAMERRRGRGILADNKTYKRKKTQIYASEIQTWGCQGECGTTVEEPNWNYRNVLLHNFSFRMVSVSDEPPRSFLGSTTSEMLYYPSNGLEVLSGSKVGFRGHGAKPPSGRNQNCNTDHKKIWIFRIRPLPHVEINRIHLGCLPVRLYDMDLHGTAHVNQFCPQPPPHKGIEIVAETCKQEKTRELGYFWIRIRPRSSVSTEQTDQIIPGTANAKAEQVKEGKEELFVMWEFTDRPETRLFIMWHL